MACILYYWLFINVKAKEKVGKNFYLYATKFCFSKGLLMEKIRKLKDSKFITPIIEMNLFSSDLCLPTLLFRLLPWPVINKLKRWNIQFTYK